MAGVSPFLPVDAPAENVVGSQVESIELPVIDFYEASTASEAVVALLASVAAIVT